MKYPVSNERGMGLIGVMVSMAIGGVLMLAVLDMNLMMVKINSTAMANSDVLAYLNQLRTNVQYAQNSTISLVGNQIVSATVTIKDPLAPTVTIAEAGYKQRAGDAWSVKAVRFENVIPVPAQLNLYRATLVVVIEMDRARVYGGSPKRKIIGDVFCLAPLGIIKSCYGGTDLVTIAETTCKSVGGVWDASKDFGSQCSYPGTNTASSSGSGSSSGSSSSGSSSSSGHNSPCDGH